MGIDAVQQAIVDHLKPAFPKALVDHFPDKFEDYDKLPTNRGAAVLVAYKGSQFGEPRGLGAVVQEQRPQFEVTVVSHKLRGEAGVLALLDAVRVRLTGHRPQGADPMRPLDEQYVPNPPGTWVYVTTWATSFPHVETVPEDDEAGYTDGTFINDTQQEAWTVDLATGDVTDSPYPEEEP